LRLQQEVMGNFTLARSTEEHAGTHSAWFWDPTQQGGGVLSDMGCHSIAAARHILTPPGKPVTFLKPIAMQCDTSLLKWGQPKYREQLLATFGVDHRKTPAEGVADAETALEKSTASRGLLSVHPNEADLYGYSTELQDAVDSFLDGKNGLLDFAYGAEITWLVQAAYMAAEKRVTLDLTDNNVKEELQTYRSLISQGKGAEVLFS
jgi:predicted dehydrogenase